MIKKYATNINGFYYISTAYRSTVIQGREFWYYETLTWTLGTEGLDKIKYEDDSGRYWDRALKNHNRIVKIFTYLENRKSRNSDCTK